jgi:hypothetical protein
VTGAGSSAADPGVESAALLDAPSADVSPNAIVEARTQRAQAAGDPNEVATLRLSVLAMALGVALASAVAVVVALSVLRRRQDLMASC